MSGGFAVGSRGVRVPADAREVIDVRFDGERIWSFHPRRERTRLNRGWVQWPRDLQPYLDGVAEVSLVQHVSGVTGPREAGRFRHQHRPGPARRQGRPRGGARQGRSPPAHVRAHRPRHDRGRPGLGRTGAARPARGVRARRVPLLRLPARRRTRRSRDRPRLRRGRVVPEPAHAPVRHHPGEQAGGRHHAVAAAGRSPGCPPGTSRSGPGPGAAAGWASTCSPPSTSTGSSTWCPR